MSIHHHPDDATLMSFSAGSLHEALAAVVACHLEMCATCAREVHDMEHLGGALMQELSPVAVTRIAPARPASAGRTAEARPAKAPTALARLLPGPLEGLGWKRIGIGVHTLKLPLSPGTTGDLRLLRVASGIKVPEHGHGGSELTLILKGAYTDRLGRFAVGDVADLDAETEHQPIVDKDGECICLVASETPARFKGLARLLQPFIGI